jgi:hypothetical protein
MKRAEAAKWNMVMDKDERTSNRLMVRTAATAGRHPA